MTVLDEIEQLLHDGDGVISVRDHPRLARSIQRSAGRGVLRPMLPGIYVGRPDGDDPDVRIRAAMAWAPEAVITGPAAARLTRWPELAVPIVTLSGRIRRSARPGFRVCQERLPAELVLPCRGGWASVPALTALDLVPWVGGRGIDDVLRSGAATLDQLHEALRLTPRRFGNSLRRAALHQSRNSPWSEAERILHRLLYRAGVRGWDGNARVECAGYSYPLDVVFRPYG